MSLATELAKPEHMKFVLPILGSGLAIVVNVGYFSALGLAWFSVLSLGEHVTLALQSLPAALCAALMLYMPFAIENVGKVLVHSGPLIQTGATLVSAAILAGIFAAVSTLAGWQSHLLIVGFLLVCVIGVGTTLHVSRSEGAAIILGLGSAILVAYLYGQTRADDKRAGIPVTVWIERAALAYMAKGEGHGKK
jgi:hypothetical protein